MISVESALEKVLSAVSELEPEHKPILQCLGQVLADDVYASFPIPPLNNAAMDGFAVMANDIQNACPDKPVVLKVIGEARAGTIFKGRLSPGTAVRIMTGAPIPEGADTVVPFEYTDECSRSLISHRLQEIAINQPLEPGSNIRCAGEDIPFGSIVLQKGHRLRPADIGIIASLGITKVSVVRRPVVAIIATGNEITPLGKPLAPGRIYNSNSFALAAQVKEAGGIPKVLGIARDNIRSIRAAIKRGISSDLLVTSGGVSAGDYDFVKNIIASEGEISFWTVRMKPGKPLAFGTIGDRFGRRIPHLGLPGNPVSAMISFELFGRPAIRKMLGLKSLTRPIIRAILKSTITNRDGRRVFARVTVVKSDGAYFATLTGEQGSGILTSMSRANGLAIIREDVPIASPGQTVEVMMLDWEQWQE